MERFKGKTVIVTGASSGIGRGVAERFSREGANVVICARHEDRLQQVAAQLPHDRTLAQVADVSKFAEVESLVAAAVKRFGGLDVIVNNAGIGTEGDALTVSLDDWNETISINLSGVFHGVFFDSFRKVRDGAKRSPDRTEKKHV